MGIYEDLKAEGAELRQDAASLFHRNQPARPPQRPQPTFTARAQTVQPAPAQGSHMSIGTEIHRVAAVLEKFGEDGIAIFEAVASNPEAQAGVIMLARMAGLPLTSGTISTAMGGLAVAENIWHTAQQAVQPQAAAPAGNGAQTVQTAKPMVV